MNKFKSLLLSIPVVLFTLSNVTPTFAYYNDISYDVIKNYSLSSSSINGSNNEDNQIPTGTVVFYETNEGRRGKMQITNYAYDMVIRWVTYNSDGSTYSSGVDLTIHGTWRCDLDVAEETVSSETADFTWNHGTEIIRSLIPSENASFAVYEEFAFFDRIPYDTLQDHTITGTSINGSNNEENQIPSGTVVFYKTNEGRLGKFQVTTYGYDLVIRWVTYDADGNVYSSGEGLTIHGTWYADLDVAQETSNSSIAEFAWSQGTEIIRSINAINSATLMLYDPNEGEVISSNTPAYISLNSATVYPNPIKDVLTIENVSNNAHWILYTMNGKQVSEGTLTNGTILFDNVKAGTYKLIINDNDKSYKHTAVIE